MLKILIGGICLAGLLGAASDTRLSDAAMQGNREAVRSLLKDRVDVDGAQGDGSTALHWAAYHDDLEMVKMLLAAGANVKVATREGAITPLFMACQNGDAAMIEALLKAGADANSVNSNGTTVLMTAAASGSADAVKVLISSRRRRKREGIGARADGADVRGRSESRRRGAIAACARGGCQCRHQVAKVEHVRFDQDGNIVEDRPGARRDGWRARRSWGREALRRAGCIRANRCRTGQGRRSCRCAGRLGRCQGRERSREGRLDTARARAAGCKSANYCVGQAEARAGDVAPARPPRRRPDFMGGMTALLYAAREGHMEAARALVEGGADVNEVSGDKFSPMVMAITNGHSTSRSICSITAPIRIWSPLSGLTALYATVDVQWAPHAWFPQPNIEQEKISYLDLMKALIEHKADVNAPIGEKLWFRSFTNDYTWVDPAGATPFWRAAQSSDIAAMKLLVEHGADPKLATKAGDTPLLAAAGIGWAANWSVNAPIPPVDAVKYCVELGNDVNAVDNRGYTALHGAAFLGDNDMVNYLVSKGAKVKAKSKAGDSVADMANGPTRFGQPHLETVALLEKLGSPNSHNCRSDSAWWRRRHLSMSGR